MARRREKDSQQMKQIALSGLWSGIRRSMILLLSAGLIVLFPGTAAAETKIQGEGFLTPEEAVEAYIDAFREKDLEKMLSCWAVESYAEHFSVETFLDQRKAFNITFLRSMTVLEKGDFSRELNIQVWKSSVISVIRKQFMWFTENGILDVRREGVPESTYDSSVQSASQFLEVMAGKDEDVITEIEFTGRWLDPDECTENSYSNEMQARNREATYLKTDGADDYASRIAVVSLSDREYVWAFDLGKYDGRWYLIAPGDSVSMFWPAGYNSGGLDDPDAVIS